MAAETPPLADASLDRARVYRTLARLFCAPQARGREPLRPSEIRELRDALARLGGEGALQAAAQEIERELSTAEPEALQRSYETTFEASGGLQCAPTETSHTETAQEALVRTFQLADVAGFYRAFGVEVAPETERPDHIAVELEFMHLLAVKEAVARGEGDAGEHLEVCRDAARAFLRDHLGRFAPRLAACLGEAASHPVYAAAGRLLEGFVAREAERLGAA